MAHSAQLGERSINPETAETAGTIAFENLTLTPSVLRADVTTRGADRAKVEDAAAAAQEGCPIPKVLKRDIALVPTVTTQLRYASSCETDTAWPEPKFTTAGWALADHPAGEPVAAVAVDFSLKQLGPQLPVAAVACMPDNDC
jgi:hypothetical protein